MFLMVDCNNFYVSCERVFRPELNNKPVLVMSNNDSCVIARSNEVKKLGIKMGEPVFKVKDKIKGNNIVCFSSNYALYGDFSSRIFNILTTFSNKVEQYSIDECFLQIIDNINFKETAIRINKTIYKWTGIPVSVGIGLNKTQAKLANYYAKKTKSPYCCFDSISDVELSNITVHEIWGIGSANTKSLKKNNISSTLSFINTPFHWIKSYYPITVQRTHAELNGSICFQIENENDKNRKSIIRSRSFGNPIEKLDHLKGALIQHIGDAINILAEEKLYANCLSVFIISANNNRFPFNSSYSVNLPNPTNQSNLIISYSLDCLQNIYKPKILYKKIGLNLYGLTENLETQLSLFPTSSSSNSSPRLGGVDIVLDKINKRWGKGTIVRATTSCDHQPWKMKQNNLSPKYTTCWKSLPLVKC